MPGRIETLAGPSGITIFTYDDANRMRTEHTRSFGVWWALVMVGGRGP